MYPRLYKAPKNKSFFLFGPRATGKTTWIKQQFKHAEYINLLDSQTYRSLLADPSRLKGMINKSSKTIVIDEVQRVPALLNEVHHLIEDEKLVFALTGSSARKLRRGAANLLAGRALTKKFLPLSIWELGESFQLEHALKYGLLPSLWGGQEENKSQYLSSYVETYLREEIMAEGLSRNLENFSRFLEMMSFSQAQVLNMSSIARDVGIDSKLVANYIEILEDLLIAERLSVFSRKAKRKLSKQSKFYFFDTGIYRTLRPHGPLDSEGELQGPALETLFLQHLNCLGEFSQWEQKTYYWRSAEKLEIDFVSYGSLGLFAFEIKRNSVLRDEDMKSLKAFQKDYPVAKCYLLYGGNSKLRRDNIEVIPYTEALKELPKIFNTKI